MKKVYLSSPFFNQKEFDSMTKAKTILQAKNCKVFVPLENTIKKDGLTEQEWAKKMFEIDRIAIDKCDVVVMLYWGLYSDSGTAWECGYAYAKNKPVVVVHCQNQNKNNLMITNGGYVNLPSIEALRNYDFTKLEKSNFYGHTSQT